MSVVLWSFGLRNMSGKDGIMGLSPNKGGAVGHVVDMAAQISQPVRVSVMSRQVIIMMTSKAKP